ncbi:hypothetical protein [Rhodococcus sp. IEGM 1330]|uniref:hypothetical protein n=1 Tax=Rhodococcus sp. IEGM 1330 TaxID=3082225 RepID=UPI0029542D3E|nr:hypothetical protein [Rhodococcus sp. IEGM 1330]MDV8022297.1 hypothetical protein [Rhodococcus sp. IEGM 1330]
MTTEREMLDLVHQRYAQAFNGTSPRYVVAEHVQFNPTWATRCLDAVVADMWPSEGFAMHGIEIKCSRGDLKRELDHPEKAATFSEHLDYFWLAISELKVTNNLTVPDQWGILIIRSGKLCVKRQARRLRPKLTGYQERDPLPRNVQVAMLRATRKTYEARSMAASGVML